MGKKVNDKKKILDIGSGTGLLMLMLAQNTEAEINGIEIDPIAFQQLQENIKQNSWSPRLKVFQGDVRRFDFTERYDFIITNPPFFENDLLSTSKEEQTAKHSTALNFEELLQVIDKQLTTEGSFGILLPYHRESEFNQKATTSGFHLMERLIIRQTPKHQPFRSILSYTRSNGTNISENELIIHKEEGGYTSSFISLLQPYYLKL